jgi:ABC-type glycerol-3-phosphate transport system permease component
MTATGTVGDGGRRRQQLSAGRILVGFTVTVLALMFLAPLAYMIAESLRNPNGAGYTLSNWSHIFSALPIATGMKNSAILAASASALTVAVTSIAGFAFAKLPFRGSRIVLFLIITTLAFPLISAIIPEYLNIAKYNLIGSYWPAILVYSGFNAAFAVIFFTNYFLSVPDAYVESAVTDGAGYFTILWRIMLPMALPALVTIGVFDFMIVWNDLLVALLFLPQPDHQTASVLLATINAGRRVHTQILLAGALLSVLPNLLVFLVFQRYLMLGYSIGVDK